MRPTIEADGLTKFYGRHRGIEDVTFAVAPGEVFGGPGKDRLRGGPGRDVER